MSYDPYKQYNVGWDKEFGSYEKFTDISQYESRLLELERSIGYMIRSAHYRSFLIHINGGKYADQRNTFIVNVDGIKNPPPQQVDIFFGLYSDPKVKEYDLLENYKKYSNTLCADLLPIGLTRSGNIICMYLNEPEVMAEAKIYFYNIQKPNTEYYMEINYQETEHIYKDNPTFISTPDDSAFGRFRLERANPRPILGNLQYISSGWSEFLDDLFSLNSPKS